MTFLELLDGGLIKSVSEVIDSLHTSAEEKAGVEEVSEERTRCEVWSRVMGYHRPVTSWNVGKRQEFADRRYFEERRVKVDK